MIDPANYFVIEALPDGREITIRSQRPEDREALRAAVARTSPESLYHRFFAVKRHFSAEEEHYFLDIDFVNHVAIVVTVNENGQSIVGGARYVVTRPASAEVSFGVIDEYQAMGIGSALMRHLASIARQRGLEELTAEVLSDNEPMIKVFERSGLAYAARREGTVVHVTMRFS